MAVVVVGGEVDNRKRRCHRAGGRERGVNGSTADGRTDGVEDAERIEDVQQLCRVPAVPVFEPRALVLDDAGHPGVVVRRRWEQCGVDDDERDRSSHRAPVPTVDRQHEQGEATHPLAAVFRVGVALSDGLAQRSGWERP